jgi:ArsR family transcriptional regulator
MTMKPAHHDFQAEILKAIAQETRLSILELLRDGERCVCEIFPAINYEQSNVSRHLNMMLKAGILTRRKEGLKIFYAVKHAEVLAIVDLAAAILKREAGHRHDLLRAG